MVNLIKTIIYRLARKTILKPKYVKHCSQTLHQSLLCYVKMYQQTGEDNWLEAIKEVTKIIIGVQHKDGGFDIGYDFDYGSKHHKGEPTTPEMLMLVSLKLAKPHLTEWEGYNSLLKCIYEAEKWIVKFSRRSDVGWEIPYSPYSDSNVVVNNAISFATGALGINLAKENELIYSGFINYMFDELQESRCGGFWHYYTRLQQSKISEDMAKKVDYYHIAQQLEMHSYAQVSNPIDNQYELIQKVESELVYKFLNKESYKLIENVAVDSQRVHVWGLASIIPGLVASYQLTGNKKATLLAIQIANYLINKSYVKQSFIPVLNPDGSHWDVSVYVRSDAWCVHALTAVLPYLSKDEAVVARRAIESVVNHIRREDYSGIENHASSLGLELIKKINFWLRRKL